MSICTEKCWGWWLTNVDNSILWCNFPLHVSVLLGHVFKKCIMLFLAAQKLKTNRWTNKIVFFFFFHKTTKLLLKTYLLVPRIGKFIAAESRQEFLRPSLPGVGGEGNGELLFNGCRISLWDGEKVMATDSSGGCTKLLTYLCHWLVHWKMVKLLNFIIQTHIHTYICVARI